MYDQPYLETCCRSALHRLVLAGPVGRPTSVPDGGCLVRLASMGLCTLRDGDRFIVTETGLARHAAEIA